MGGLAGSPAFAPGQLASLLEVFLDSPGGPHACDASTRAQPFELAVLEYFAGVAGALLSDVYGCVAPSSAEALLHGLAAARLALPAACVYVCDQAHDRVRQACELLRMEVVNVASVPEGTMDTDDLRLQVLQRRRAAGGAIVVASCGTPMRGAVDDIVALRAAAEAAGAVYVHVDAADGGLIAAHTIPQPNWSFAYGADSLNMSGHRVLGLPVPAGISLVRHPLPWTADSVPIAGLDRTLACSRSELASLLLWARLRSLGRSGMFAMISRCHEVAAYAVARLDEAGVCPGHVPGSLTVTFDRPPAWVMDKWNLACVGHMAQIVTTGPLTHAAVDELAADLSAARLEAVA